MSYLINNQQNLNEIIFANRNKRYGAYAIRSAYGNTLFKSLSIMILGFGTFISIAYYFSNRNNLPEQKSALPVYTDTMVTVFDLKRDEIHEIEKPRENNTKSSSSTASSDNTSTTISDTVSVDTHSVLNADAVTGKSVNTGTPGIGNDVTGTTTGTSTTTSTISSDPTDLIFVDTAPEFEGGLNALRRFVANNVKYPSRASGDGISGTVHVKFVVDEKGKVCNLTLQNNVGYGLDEEALRVVGLIPDFKKPALVKGVPVKVYYQLPIKFKLN